MTELRQLAPIHVEVSGARGPSTGDMARRTGAWGVESEDTDTQVLEKFADYAITQNPGFQSQIPGPAGPTYVTLASFKAAPISNRKQALKTANVSADFYWQAGDYTGQADDKTIIASDNAPLTEGAWVVPNATAFSYGRTNIALPADKSIPRTLAWAARVDPFTTASQQSKLENAFEVAANEGYKLEGHPDANYRHDGPLTLGSSFDGRGAVFTGLSDGFQAIMVQPGSKGIRLANLKTLSATAPEDRTTFNEGNGISIGDQGQPVIEDVWLENIEVGGVTSGVGTGGAGFWFANVRNLRGNGLIARDTAADGFHFTHGAKHCRLWAPLAERCGDDGCAVVSYREYGLLCEDIQVYGLVSNDGGARGASIIGGKDVVYLYPTIRRSAAAAAYIVAEDFFDTLGNENCHIVGFRADGCCIGGGSVQPGTTNAVAHIWGRTGTEDVVEGYTLSRLSVECSISGKIVGAGPIAPQLFSMNQYTIRSKIVLDMQNVPANIPGALLSGIDYDAQLTGRNIGGVPIIIDSGSKGRGYIHDTKFENARTANPAADVCILSNGPTPDLTELRIERAEFNDTSATLINQDSGLDMRKVRWAAVKLDGKETGKDFATGTPTYAGGWTSADMKVLLGADGQVQVTGVLTGGSGTHLMTLPVGFRPASFTGGFAVTNGNAMACTVDGSGVVALTPAPTTAVTLNFTFLVGN